MSATERSDDTAAAVLALRSLAELGWPCTVDAANKSIVIRDEKLALIIGGRNLESLVEVGRTIFRGSVPAKTRELIVLQWLRMVLDEKATALEAGFAIQALTPSEELNPSDPANDVHPPELAEYLLWYLPVDKETREAVIGDLEEEYRIVYGRFGRREAIIWYYYQVGASFWPFAARKVERLIKLGMLGWVGELFRRMIS